MKRYLSALVSLVVLVWCWACNSSGAANTPALAVNVTGAFTTVEAGTGPITLTATVIGDTKNRGVSWTLSIANDNCSPACGTLQTTSNFFPNLTATYTPPTTAPANQQATLTVRSLTDDRQAFVFNFQILPPIAVGIKWQFTSQTVGGPPVGLTAVVTNDPSNAGVTWTITAGGVDCQTKCGTLTPDPVPALTATYTPPTVPATGANASPTITVASNKDSSKTANFTFNIVSPPISVTITNKFTQVAGGSPSITVNASVAKDFSGSGVTWTLKAGTQLCAPTCGTLVASAAPSFSATYTPPPTVPTGAAATPTISASSVFDTTKSDSFSFSIVGALALFKGTYALSLRGFDQTATTPMTLSGILISDGNGNITGGEYDLNDGGVITSVPSSPALSGTYTIDTSFQGIARVQITVAGTPNNLVLKGALSGDGKRGRVIELDNGFFLNAGTLALQDPAAVSASSVPGSYAFGVDSDAGLFAANSGRIVEAGQFILGAGATSVTGGVADASQANAATQVFGDPQNGPATLDGAASSATPPDALGRGTMTLSYAGNATNYAYYVVTSQQLNLIEIDNGGTLKTVQSGTAQRQVSLNANTVNGTSVVALTGSAFTNGPTPLPDVIIGVLSISGAAGTPVITAAYDRNSGGQVFTVQQAPTGILFSPFNTATGRSVLVRTMIFGAALYTYDAGKGYLIDVTPAGQGGNRAFSGMLVPQAAGPFSAGDLGGNMIGGGGGSSSASIPNLDFAANFDGSAFYTSEADFTTSNTGVGANGQGQNINLGGQFLLQNTGNGRGLITFTPGVFGDFSSGGPAIAAFYVVGPGQFVAIDLAPGGTSGPGDQSGILFFDPQ